MQIEMKQTRYGCEDGFSVKLFHSGEIYNMADSLAHNFIKWGAAVKVEQPEIKSVGDILFDAFNPTAFAKAFNQ